MVESSHKSNGVKRSHDQIAKLLDGSKNLSLSDLDANDLSRSINKMPERNDRKTIEQTVDVLFEQAASKADSDDTKELLSNLRKLVGKVEEDLYRPKAKYLDAFFFPNKANVKKLVKWIKMAKKNINICVFNLTNDDLAAAVIERHNAGVKVRVVSDDECMTNKGSDIQKLADAGIPVRTDDAPTFHMHNKFMIVDDLFLLTGSFNWTFQAGSSNQENLLVVDHPYYIEKYTAEYEKLWDQFNRNEVERKQQAAAKVIQKNYRSK